jgi:hypothetical protein
MHCSSCFDFELSKIITRVGNEWHVKSVGLLNSRNCIFICVNFPALLQCVIIIRILLYLGTLLNDIRSNLQSTQQLPNKCRFIKITCCPHCQHPDANFQFTSHIDPPSWLCSMPMGISETQGESTTANFDRPQITIESLIVIRKTDRSYPG